MQQEKQKDRQTLGMQARDILTSACLWLSLRKRYLLSFTITTSLFTHFCLFKSRYSIEYACMRSAQSSQTPSCRETEKQKDKTHPPFRHAWQAGRTFQSNPINPINPDGNSTQLNSPYSDSTQILTYLVSPWIPVLSYSTLSS